MGEMNKIEAMGVMGKIGAMGGIGTSPFCSRVAFSLPATIATSLFTDIKKDTREFLEQE